MSNITNWFIDNFGADKVLHFLGGAWITSMLTVFGWNGIISATFVVFILSFIKEQFMDEEFDKWDITAAMIGYAVSTIIYGIYWLIFV